MIHKDYDHNKSVLKTCSELAAALYFKSVEAAEYYITC